MGQCASKRSGKPRINQPINRINEPINTQEDDHHYDDVNYDMMYDEIDESQIVDNIPASTSSSGGNANTTAYNYAYTTSNPTVPNNNVPVPASSSSGHMSDVGYELPVRNLDMSCNILPVHASSGDGHINDESYDDAISCPRMHRVNLHSEGGSVEADSGADSHGYSRNCTDSPSSYLSVNSHTERGSMEASSGTYSQSSNTSLRSLVSVGKSYQMLYYDLETMVEIFRDEIEEDVDARRVVIYLTFLPPFYDREINQAYYKSPRKAMKMLIDQMKKVRENGKWETFVTALERVGYESIAKDLRGEFQEDNTEKRTIVRIFAPTLVNQINPLEITPLLYSRNIICPSDKEEIEREQYTFGKISAARRLLRCLHHKCSSWFEQFCDILKECGYSDLAELLNPQTAHLHSQDTDTLSSGDLSCFQSSEERPARLKPKTQYQNIEEELQESLTDLQLWLEGLETNVGGHIGQREHSRGKEFENSQLSTTSCNLEQMANYRTIIEEKATEISNKCQQGLEQTLRKTLIPEFRSIMEETLSRYIESFRDEIRQEIRSVRDNISRESRSRAWIYRSSHYPVSSSGYVSENTSVYEPIKETDEEYSYTESKGIYENNLTKQ